MKGKNYSGWMTKYLGVMISLKLDPLADWKEVLAKMGEAASRIKKFRLKGASKIRAVNTFVILIMTYLGRFKIMNQDVCKEMLKILRRALGAQANTPARILLGERKPFNVAPRLRHLVLHNWALLNSCKPLMDNPMNLAAISESRKEANQAVERLCRKPHTKGGSSLRTYKRLAMQLGPTIADLIQEPG
jgi:hypothetical protein